MVSKRSSKKSVGRSVKASRIGGKKLLLKKKDAKTMHPEIHVKKTSYSRAARHSVLSSAAARQQLIEMGGENTIDIIREFDKDMSDEELARKTGVRASDVRVVLNRLHSCGLFTYTRVRDRDSGWYSYIWKMNEGKLRDFASEQAVEFVEEGREEVVEVDYLRKNSLGVEEEVKVVGARRPPRF